MSSSVRALFRWIALILVSWEYVSCQKKIDKLKDCGKRDRCLGRSPALNVAPQYMTTNEIKSVQCFCDDQCWDFGDCCQDITTYPDMKLRKNWGCVPLSYNQSVFAITSCNSRDDKLKALCEKSVSENEYHYSLDVPVYSTSSRNYYANVYCALCEGQKDSIEPIRLLMKCTNESTTIKDIKKRGIYKVGELLWETNKGQCFLITTSTLTHGRPCVSSVSTCKEMSDPMAEICPAYTQIVTTGIKRFKNPHCALCNGVSISSLTCWQGFDYRTLPSLSMLFDFDWNFETCDIPKSVWDGIERRCKKICTESEKCKTCKDSSCRENSSDLTLIVEGYLTIVCLSVSIFCLFLHIFLSFFLPNSGTLPAKILNSLSISLVIAQMLFLCGIDPLIDVPKDICQSVAILIHFFFLASFFWMNVMSIDIWRTFSNNSLKGQKSRNHRKYATYAWCSTGIVTISSLVLDLTDWIPDNYRPHYAEVENICWFANRIGLGIFFYLPITILLFLNSVLFGITVCWFQKQHSKSEVLKTTGRKEYTRLWLYIKLFVIMGLTWACGMISALAEKPNFRYPFIVLNGLQGFFLFVMFDIKSGVMTQILRKMGIKKYQTTDVEQKKSVGTQSSKMSSSNSNKKTST